MSAEALALSQQLSSSAALKPWYTVWEAMLPRRATRCPAAERIPVTLRHGCALHFFVFFTNFYFLSALKQHHKFWHSFVVCFMHYAFCICNRVGLAKVCILYSVFCILYFRSHPWPLGFGKGLYFVFCIWQQIVFCILWQELDACFSSTPVDLRR